MDWPCQSGLRSECFVSILVPMQRARVRTSIHEPILVKSDDDDRSSYGIRATIVSRRGSGLSWKVEQGEPLPGSRDKRSIASRGDNDKLVSPSLSVAGEIGIDATYIEITFDARTVLRTLYLWLTTFDFFLKGRTGFSSYRGTVRSLLAWKNRKTLETGFSRWGGIFIVLLLQYSRISFGKQFLPLAFGNIFLTI